MTKNLQTFRDQIDRIDNNLIMLLEQRIKIAKEIGNTKKDNSFIKPAREQEIMQKLMKTKGVFPKPVLIAIWRKIITASLMIQTDFKIGIFCPNKYQESILILNDHFGSFVKIKKYNDISKLTTDLKNQKITIGFLEKEEYSRISKNSDLKVLNKINNFVIIDSSK